MRWLIILLMILFSTSTYAAPFLICDAVDPEACGSTDQPPCPVSATVYEDGEVIASEIPLQTDMSIRYDLAGRPPGTHRYTTIYHDAFGGLSLQSNPTRLGPVEPQNTRLSP